MATFATTKSTVAPSTKATTNGANPNTPELAFLRSLTVVNPTKADKNGQVEVSGSVDVTKREARGVSRRITSASQRLDAPVIKWAEDTADGVRIYVQKVSVEDYNAVTGNDWAKMQAERKASKA